MTKSEEWHPLEKVIRELNPDFPEDGIKLIDQYEEAIKQNGLESKDVIDLYDTIVGENESMKRWLDAINRLTLHGNYPV